MTDYFTRPNICYTFTAWTYNSAHFQFHPFKLHFYLKQQVNVLNFVLTKATSKAAQRPSCSPTPCFPCTAQQCCPLVQHLPHCSLSLMSHACMLTPSARREKSARSWSSRASLGGKWQKNQQVLQSRQLMETSASIGTMWSAGAGQIMSGVMWGRALLRVCVPPAAVQHTAQQGLTWGHTQSYRCLVPTKTWKKTSSFQCNNPSLALCFSWYNLLRALNCDINDNTGELSSYHPSFSVLIQKLIFFISPKSTELN